MIAVTIAFYIEDPAKNAEGTKLASKLHLPLTSEPETFTIVLALTSKHLELRLPNEKIKPIFVDFLTKSAEQRLLGNRGRTELIARAVGIKSHSLPSVIDTTAGLGSDAMILAHLGCHVTMIERSPIIFALLEDGLKRAENLPWLANMDLHCLDARNFLQDRIETKQYADVIYLDPMFPERIKSALVKKEMRILKLLVGHDEDAGQLFDLAKQCAKKRVVVKRPRHAGSLTKETPTLKFEGKACRFDVYII